MVRTYNTQIYIMEIVFLYRSELVELLHAVNENRNFLHIKTFLLPSVISGLVPVCIAAMLY